MINGKVALDALLIENTAAGGPGGVISLTGEVVNGVSYRVAFFFCGLLDMRSTFLAETLKLHGIDTTGVRMPGVYAPW